MFVRTNAAIPPGVEIDIHLAASISAPAMTVRALVARRRSVPANLRSLINPGLGLRVLEAPREFGLLFSSELLDSPIQLKSDLTDWGSESASASESVPTQSPIEKVSKAGSVAPPPPQAAAKGSTSARAQRTRNRPFAPTTVANSAFKIGGTPSAEAMKPKAVATAVLVGGDELHEIEDILVEFGVELIHREPTDPQLKVLGEARLLIVSARLAIAHSIPVGGAATVSVAVCEEVSGTMRTLLRKQGFEYLIRQPVNSEALRLLMRYALFDQSDRRSRTRLPFGYEVSWRMGWRRDTGELLDISIDGCRLLVADGMPLDSRMHLKIPSEVGGGQPLKLSATVIRSSRHRSGDDRERYAVGLAFDELSSKMREQLTRFCGLWVGTLPVARGEDSLASSQSKPKEEAAAPAQSVASDPSSQAEPAIETLAPAVASEATQETHSGDEIPQVEGLHHEEVTPEAGPSKDSCDQESDPETEERRQSPRGLLNREIVEVDSGKRVVQALLGRDLSMGGIRIDPQFGLSSGDKLDIALFDVGRGEPLILHSEVSRDDGGAGMVLCFMGLSTENEENLAAIIAALPAVESLGKSRNSTVVPAGILSEDKDPAAS
jgi:hypothetical protein